MQFSEEVIREILEFLWQRHVAGEHQYLYWVLLSPLLAVGMFIVLWYKHRGHLGSMLDALRFFFAPYGPEKMVLFKDLLGNQYTIYDYSVVKGSQGYIMQLGPYLVKTTEDPDSYAEPVSLLDARGPPGVASPFGLFVRWLVSGYIMLALVAIAFVNTFWTTYTVYSKALGVPFTSIDLLSFAALVIGSAWFVAVITRAMSPQTLLTSITAIGSDDKYIIASPGLDVYSSYPPSKLLESIDRTPKIVLGDEVKKIVDEIKEQLGDTTLAASILAIIGQIYNTWRKSMGILLKDRYDISVAGRARYQLSEEKLNVGWLQRHAGIIAFAALIGIVIVAAYMLHPSLAPAANSTVTNTSVGNWGVTPAPPPTPPTHMPTATPAPPPSPNLTPPTSG